MLNFKIISVGNSYRTGERGMEYPHSLLCTDTASANARPTAGKVTAGLAESNGSLPLGSWYACVGLVGGGGSHHGVHDHVCCHLQADCLESGISSGPLRSTMSTGTFTFLMHQVPDFLQALPPLDLRYKWRIWATWPDRNWDLYVSFYILQQTLLTN